MSREPRAPRRPADSGGSVPAAGRRSPPSGGRPPGEIRIVGGRWRGRRLPVCAIDGLRPTPDRVRETLFNWLGQDLTGLRCLDAYAGSGALGFESASRGAREVVLVERDAQAARVLQEGCERLGAQACVRVVRGDALHFLRQAAERQSFDVIFLDPPFGSDQLPAAIEAARGCLAVDGLIYVEADRLPDPGIGWRWVRQSRAGHVACGLLAPADEPPDHPPSGAGDTP